MFFTCQDLVVQVFVLYLHVVRKISYSFILVTCSNTLVHVVMYSDNGPRLPSVLCYALQFDRL
jgi:hypothetical protein